MIHIKEKKDIIRKSILETPILYVNVFNRSNQTYIEAISKPKFKVILYKGYIYKFLVSVEECQLDSTYLVSHSVSLVEYIRVGSTNMVSTRKMLNLDK